MKCAKAIAAVLVGLALLAASPTQAADYNAAASGDWSAPATWGLSTGFPGATDNARIQSGGVTVTMDGGINRTVSGLNLYYGGALARSASELLTVAGQIDVRDGSSLAMSAGDVGYTMYVGGNSSNAASVTTAGVTNVLASVQVQENAALTLGAALNLGKPGYYNGDIVIGGAYWPGDPRIAGQINMNGYNIVTDNIRIGDNGAGVITRTGAETISARSSISVWRGSTLAMVAGDRCTSLQVYSDNNGMWGTATVTTASTANITSSVNVSEDSVLNLGANLVLGKVGYYGGDIVVGGAYWPGDPRPAGTINMNGYNIVTDNIRIGDNGAGVITRTGAETISARSGISVWRGSTLTMVAGDRCTSLQVYSDNNGMWGTATVTTASTANITSSVNVSEDSVLNLGADLVLGKVGFYGGDIVVGGAYWPGDPRPAGTINMNGCNIVTDNIRIGDNGAGVITRTGAETISARSGISVWRGSTLTMVAGDRCRDLQIYNDNGGMWGTTTVTTASSANITNSISVNQDSVLNLGADLALTGDMNIDGGTVEAFGGQTASLANLRINSSGALNVLQDASLQGLTLSASSLQISSAQMVLTFVATDAGDWAFRWTGDHQTALSAMLGDGRISDTAGAAVFYDGNYTYIGFAPIGGAMSIPEPATMSLLALGALALVRRNRRK